jgi:hypothetical protein
MNTIWEQISPQTIGSVVIEFLTYRANDGLLVVGTHGNGIYQTKLSSVGDILALDNIKNIDNIILYPNPSTDIVNIDFSLQRDSDTKWTLYSEVGKTIIKGSYKSAVGSNKLKIDSKNLKAGIYFISIEVDGQLVTKQFVKQ